MGDEALQFGKYTLLERLAMGGMAEVFRAKTHAAAGFGEGRRHQAHPAAVLHRRRFRPHVRRRSAHRRQASTTANIVQIFDFDNAVYGRKIPAYYIAMELVEGKDLRQTVLARECERVGPCRCPQLRHVCDRRAEGAALCAHEDPMRRVCHSGIDAP